MSVDQLSGSAGGCRAEGWVVSECIIGVGWCGGGIAEVWVSGYEWFRADVSVGNIKDGSGM